jgi:hypothetical protein
MSTVQPPSRPISVAMTIRRRSTESARAPPTKAVTSSGRSSARPRRPTARLECVRRYVCQGSATYVIMLPRNETNWAA